MLDVVLVVSASTSKATARRGCDSQRCERGVDCHVVTLRAGVVDRVELVERRRACVVSSSCLDVLCARAARRRRQVGDALRQLPRRGHPVRGGSSPGRRVHGQGGSCVQLMPRRRYGSWAAESDRRARGVVVQPAPGRATPGLPGVPLPGAPQAPLACGWGWAAPWPLAAPSSADAPRFAHGAVRSPTEARAASTPPGISVADSGCVLAPPWGSRVDHWRGSGCGSSSASTTPRQNEIAEAKLRTARKGGALLAGDR